jgi:hypothetical protein
MTEEGSEKAYREKQAEKAKNKKKYHFPNFPRPPVPPYPELNPLHSLPQRTRYPADNRRLFDEFDDYSEEDEAEDLYDVEDEDRDAKVFEELDTKLLEKSILEGNALKIVPARIPVHPHANVHGAGRAGAGIAFATYDASGNGHCYGVGGGVGGSLGVGRSYSANGDSSAAVSGGTAAAAGGGGEGMRGGLTSRGTAGSDIPPTDSRGTKEIVVKLPVLPSLHQSGVGPVITTVSSSDLSPLRRYNRISTSMSSWSSVPGTVVDPLELFPDRPTSKSQKERKDALQRYAVFAHKKIPFNYNIIEPLPRALEPFRKLIVAALVAAFSTIILSTITERVLRVFL